MSTHKRHPTTRTLAAVLQRLVREAEDWAAEYIKREERYRRRGAYREAAHYEDLIAAHQCHAEELRQILAMLPNSELRRAGHLSNNKQTGATPRRLE